MKIKKTGKIFGVLNFVVVKTIAIFTSIKVDG